MTETKSRKKRAEPSAKLPKTEASKADVEAEQLPKNHREILAVMPSFQSAVTLGKFNMAVGELDAFELATQLKQQIKECNEGNLTMVEAMLFTQAKTLESIFHSITRQALANQSNIIHFERLFRLGLKAQSQSRATLETLAQVKNPQPVAFVRQANITNGPQQINNGVQDKHSSRAQETQNAPNKLLEQEHGEQRLDSRAPGTAIPNDLAMATVG